MPGTLTGTESPGLVKLFSMNKEGTRQTIGILLCFLLICWYADVSAQRGHIPPGLAERYVEENRFGIHFRYAPVVSYGLANASFPFSKNHPQYLSDMFGVDVVFFFAGDKLQHHLRTSLSLPAYIYSEAGSGSGFYVDRYKSSGRRHQQLYSVNLSVWSPGFLTIMAGLTTVVQYESRSIHYYSERIDEQWNAGLAVGPHFSLALPIIKPFTIRGEAHIPAYLPYTNMGRIRTRNSRSTHFESGFHAMTYAPFIDLQGLVRMREELLLVVGYRYMVQMGYGHDHFSFSRNGLLTYSFDEIREYYAGIRYTMPARWTRRRPLPACPLNTR